MNRALTRGAMRARLLSLGAWGLGPGASICLKTVRIEDEGELTFRETL